MVYSDQCEYDTSLSIGFYSTVSADHTTYSTLIGIPPGFIVSCQATKIDEYVHVRGERKRQDDAAAALPRASMAARASL